MADPIRPLRDGDRPWVRSFLTEQLGSPRIASRGRLHELDVAQPRDEVPEDGSIFDRIRGAFS